MHPIRPTLIVPLKLPSVFVQRQPFNFLEWQPDINGREVKVRFGGISENFADCVKVTKAKFGVRLNVTPFAPLVPCLNDSDRQRFTLRHKLVQKLFRVLQVFSEVLRVSPEAN
jgi:hypothetical protein